jgi:CRP-like cAMP-binding protein
VLGISDVLSAGGVVARPAPPKAAARPPAAPAAPAAPDARARREAVPGPPRVPDLASSVIDLADELVIAPDVAPGETRFSNAPPARGVRVDMTAAELTPRRRAPSAPISSHKPPRTAASLSKLPLFPLFAELPQLVLVELIKSSTVIEADEGVPVVRAGEPADALYGIIEGSVEVAVPGQSLKMTLAEGDVFGEACLLPAEIRRANVTVRGHLVAIRLARELLSQIIGMHPPIAEVLLDLLTRRLLTNLLQSAPMFQELDTRGRQHMVELFEIRRAPGGTRLAVAGKTMDGLYITLTGRVVVEGMYGSTEVHDAGTMFGQSSLLMNERSDVTITTQSPMLLLRLPAQAFHSAVMQYPGMLAHLSELAGNTLAKVST